MYALKNIGLTIVATLWLIGCGSSSSTAIEGEKNPRRTIPIKKVPIELEKRFLLNENRDKEILLFIDDKPIEASSWQVKDAPNHGTFSNGHYTPQKGYVGEDYFVLSLIREGLRDLLAEISLTIQADFDGDDIADINDTDDDNDGVLDIEDVFPLDANETVDTDGDGIGNNADSDDDNDGIADSEDSFPLNFVERVDSDGDGVGDNEDADDDNDGVSDTEDVFPLDATESLDSDKDGVGDNADMDDDNDGVVDTEDAFPLNPAESLDSDGDGIGNNEDSDDDNDGTVDVQDDLPLDANETVDTDSDGIGNNADSDDDNDGVADASDAFPLNAAESIDTDGDGIGNNEDSDDDNDGISDSDELANGTNPLVPNQPTTTVSISGKVEYERINPLHAGKNSRLDLNSVSTLPTREVVVKVVDDTGTVIASTTTNNNGEYSFSEIPKESNVKIRVYARMNKADKWRVDVVDNVYGDAQYVLDGELANTGSSNSVRNLKAIASTKNSPPFAILDSVYSAMKKVLDVDTNAVFPLLYLKWSVSNVNSGTYYDGVDGIMLQGDQDGDSDEYDDHIVVHEWGHYFEKKFSRSDSIGGQHGGGDRLDIRVAFGEGFGNAFSAIVTDNPLYYDTYNSSGWNMNIESASKYNTGWFSEASVQRILYDLYDAADDGEDRLTFGFKPLYDVFVGAQKSTVAFTSLFSFITALKNENGNEVGNIDAIVSSEEIAPISDIYGTGRSSNSASSPYFDYQALGTTLRIATSSSDGASSPYNKLSNRKYIKFTIASSGNYRISVQQSNGSVGRADPDFYLYTTTPFKLLADSSENSPNGGEEKTVTLNSGDYLLDVVNWNEINALFDVKIESE